MSDDLDALLREHYRAAADEIRPDPAAVRRFQDAGRAAAPMRARAARARAARRWTLPTLAAAVTAAVLVAVAVLFWPGVREPEPPRPMAPPVSPVSPAPPEPSESWPGPLTPSPIPSTSEPGRTAMPEASRPGSAGVPTGPAPTASPTPGVGGRPAGRPYG